MERRNTVTVCRTTTRLFGNLISNYRNLREVVDEVVQDCEKLRLTPYGVIAKRVREHYAEPPPVWLVRYMLRMPYYHLENSGWRTNNAYQRTTRKRVRSFPKSKFR